MKQLKLILSTACLGALLCSCSGDSYRHQVGIEYPSMEKFVYADQVTDSVIFITYDSYEVTSVNSPWIVPVPTNSPVSATLPNMYFSCYRVAVNLQIAPNTSEHCRIGYIKVRSYGTDWNESTQAAYYQTVWHNIKQPIPTYTMDANKSVTAAVFEAKDSANQIVQDLEFETYSKWRLNVPEGSFVSVPENVVTSGGEGSHKLQLSMEKNTSTAARSTVLQLESESGVKTDIKITQEGMKK
ncbi:MAG: BACON domain-containing protein [Bacteroidales bacterium]|nr:BACON domain-containing protein [Candidatus Physcousia equi]